jgi:hypothetical protein
MVIVILILLAVLMVMVIDIVMVEIIIISHSPRHGTGCEFGHCYGSCFRNVRVKDFHPLS